MFIEITFYNHYFKFQTNFFLIGEPIDHIYNKNITKLKLKTLYNYVSLSSVFSCLQTILTSTLIFICLRCVVRAGFAMVL